MFSSTSLVVLSVASAALAQTYSATYDPNNTPDKSEAGQSGTNQCGNGNNQNSMCQNVYVNSLDDWCVFAPPQPNSVIGETERIEVAWCIQGGHGTRVIPDGAIKGAHFVQTPEYVQVTGVGDLTKLNIQPGDAGGELDPHGADGNGNPIGGLVFSSAFGGVKQMHEWTNFISADEFCIRACKDGPKATKYCEHIYDVMGCYWNMPGDYSAGSFDSCKGDSGDPMGVYGTSTFHQGQPTTPPAHPPPAKSQCNKVNTIGNGVRVPTTPVTTTTAQPTVSTVSTSTSSGLAQITSTSSQVPSTSSAASTDSVSSASTSAASSRITTSASGRTTAPAAPTPLASGTPLGTGSGSGSGSAGAAPTSANNGAASHFGRGVEAMVAGAALIVGALVVA